MIFKFVSLCVVRWDWKNVQILQAGLSSFLGGKHTGPGGKRPGQINPPIQPLTPSSLSWSNNTIVIHQRGHPQALWMMERNQATASSASGVKADCILQRHPQLPCPVSDYSFVPAHTFGPHIPLLPVSLSGRGISEAFEKTGIMHVYWYFCHYRARQWWKKYLQKRYNIVKMLQSKLQFKVQHSQYQKLNIFKVSKV